MIDYITYYFGVGLVWLIIHELFLKNEMTDGLRVRLFTLWPFTLSAWIIGFLDAMYYSLFDNDDE